MTCGRRGGVRIVIGLSLFGCSGDRPIAPSAEVVDSAGVQIVTYDLTDTAVLSYVMVDEHDLEIGVLEGVAEYTFSNVSDVRTRDDGSIIVADEGAGEILVYDTDGGHSLTLGRRGDGPGEFATGPVIAGLAGDTVYAWDSGHRRVTSFSGEGDLLETTTLQAESIGPLRVVRQDDGTYLAQSRWISPVAEAVGPHDARVELDSVMIEHIDATGAIIDTVRVLADMERATMRTASGAGRVRMQMMPRPLTARAFMRTDGVRPIIAHNGSFELISYGRDGAPQVVLRVQGAWPAVTAEDIRSRLEARLVEVSAEREIDPRTLRVYEEFMPERTPDFSNVIISDSRDIWVSQYEYEFDLSNGFDWLVFSSAGELRGSVSTPPGLRVFDIQDDYVVGVVRDELDVQYVRRYPLAPTR